MSIPVLETSTPATWVDLLRSRARERPDRHAYTFLVDGEEREVHFTYAQLDQRARIIAAQLQSLGAAKKPVLLLYSAGLEYIAAFMGCLYAGAVAVPLYPPRPNRGLKRLEAVVQDSQARIVLTEDSIRSRLRLTGSGVDLSSLTWVTTDSLDEAGAEDWKMPDINGESLAFLQYTSGSTSQPKGVMVSHVHLFHNTRTIQQAFQQSADSTMVGWLPLFHDMGLIGVVLQSLMIGSHCILMAPEAFLMQPFRWLQAISRYRAHTSGAPNFAYELCASRVTAEQRAQLDLSCWKVAFNGAEPVRDSTLEKFTERFESCGFRQNALYPCYGLAEATLFVSGGVVTDGPRILGVDSDALEHGRAVVADPGSRKVRTLVSCGRTWGSDLIEIVNPETRLRCPPHTVGEIWVAGPSVTAGYWNREHETHGTFGASLAETGEGPFLRTGDLGFILDGELFVTGRLKDLLICGGRNHYPNDIEHTIEQSHAAIRSGCCAAFSVDEDGEEKLVIAAEIDRQFRLTLRLEESVVHSIRNAVAHGHDLRVDKVLLLRHGGIPKTSSGKIQRHACRAGYLGGNINLVRCDHD